MLHSYQYYACYYTLLCLLNFYQGASSLTIIIDGATTNEWATGDEYRRLVDSSQGPAPPPPLNGQLVGEPLDQPASYAQRRPQPAAAERQQQEWLAEQQPGGGPAASSTLPAGPSLEGLRSAAGPLDLIEPASEQRLRQQQRQQRLRQRQRLQQHQYLEPKSRHSGMRAPLQEDIEQQQQQQQQGQSQRQWTPAMGARTINELVPHGDQDLPDPSDRIKARGSNGQHYCGYDLLQVLDLVCQGEYYTPEIQNPSIMRRHADFDRHRQSKRVTGECCKNSCTMDQLKIYCKQTLKP